MAGCGVVEALLAQKPAQASEKTSAKASDKISNWSITIFGDEPHPNYNRILLSDVLAGKTVPAKIILNPPEWYKDNGIDLRLGVPISAIDVAGRSVVDRLGMHTPYDALVLAVGGLPFVPPIPGCDQEGVRVFRTLDETEEIIVAARVAKQVVVIGGGLLGLEAARGLINYGVNVTVAHLADRLMEQQLDAVGGAVLKREMERMGIRVVLNTTATEILGEGRVTGVRLTTGEVIPARMALVTTGIRPNIALALAAGIPCNRGIVVNDHMETGVPGIYAVGDAIEHRGKTYGLVAPLKAQAAVLADRIAGEGKRRYEGTICATTLKVAGINLTSAGDFIATAGAEEIAFLDTQHAVYKKCVLRQGRLVGFILLGDNKDGARLFNLIQKGEDVSAIKAGLIGEVARETGAEGGVVSGVFAMADSDTICNCNSVTKGAILSAIKEQGCKTREAVATCTQATTGCGSCAQMVDDLLVGPGKPSAPAVTAAHPSRMEQKAVSLKTLDLEKVKQEGLAVDFGRLKAFGTADLVPGDYYRLKTYGFCSQKHPGYFMLRIRIPGGRLNPAQMAHLADLSKQHGRGWGHLTVRQNLELHFVRVEDASDIIAGLRSVGLTNRSACGHTMRNVMACPHGGIAEEGVLDVQPWAAAITDYFVRRSDLINPTMPNRLNIYFSGCPACNADAIINDIAFVSKRQVSPDGRAEMGFEVWLGGSLGAHPIFGFKQRDFIPLADALPACQALFALHTQFGSRNKARSRLKFLIEQWGREKFSAMFDRYFEEKKNLPENRDVPLPPSTEASPALSSEPAPRAVQRGINALLPRIQRLHAAAIPQKQKGYARLVIAVPLGEIRAEQIRAVGRIAQQFGNGHVHFTREQAMELHWIPDYAVGRVAAKLARVGLTLQDGHAGLKVLACPGTEFCVLAVTNAQGAAKDIRKWLQSTDPEKQALLNQISIHISGCPNSCAKHQIGDIGLAGTLLPVGPSRMFSYQLYLGGAAEGALRLGEMVRKGITEEMVIPTVDALLEIALIQRRVGESFQQVVDRLSPKKVADLLEARIAPFVPEDAPALEMTPVEMSVTADLAAMVGAR